MNQEHILQNKIRVALSSKDSFVVRTNAGRFWQGKKVFSKEFGQWVLINLRPIYGLPEGFSDLIYIGKDRIAFIEVKRKGEAPRQRQSDFLKRVKELGHRAGVAHSIDEARRIVDCD